MDVDVPDASQNYLCPHIDAVFAVEAERVSMLKKYKAAVVWAAQMGARGERAAKKRKVCTIPSLTRLHSQNVEDSDADMRDVQPSLAQAVYMLALFIWRMLARWPYRQPLEGLESSFL